MARRDESTDFVAENPQMDRGSRFNGMTGAQALASQKPRPGVEQETAELLQAAGLGHEMPGGIGGGGRDAEGTSKGKGKGNGKSGLGDALPEAEELRALGVSEEEVKRRKAQLQKLKALLSYDEEKRRRANKIKSKTFRKLRKKRLSRQQEEEARAAAEADETGDLARQLEHSALVQRARERATLKHRVRKRGKWAARVLRAGGLEHEEATREEARREIEGRLRDVDRLKERMQRAGRGGGYGGGGGGDSSDADSGYDDSEGSGDEGGDAGALRRARDRVLALGRDGSGAREQEARDAPEPEGLEAMAFMRRAAEVGRKEADAETQAMAAELEQAAREQESEDGDSTGDAMDSSDDDTEERGGLGTGSRRSFGPAKALTQKEKQRQRREEADKNTKKKSANVGGS